MNKKGQSVFEFILAFAAILLLVVGITRIWVWFNANYGIRQASYQGERWSAGRVSGTNLALSTSPYRPLNYVDGRVDLTEDWVFRGQAGALGAFGSGGVSGSAGYTPGMCDNNVINQMQAQIYRMADTLATQGQNLIRIGQSWIDHANWCEDHTAWPIRPRQCRMFAWPGTDDDPNDDQLTYNEWRAQGQEMKEQGWQLLFQSIQMRISVQNSGLYDCNNIMWQNAQYNTQGQ